MRKIITIGWDGRSNPIYRYEDEMKRSDHRRDRPSIHEILEQYPNATYCNADFKTVPLAELLNCRLTG